MDCGIAAPSRIAAGSLLKKQAAGIKHSKRAIETGGQRHGALLRTAYSGIRSRRVEAACAVSNSTAPADLVEREVVAVLQDLPGTTFNTLLATLAKSSSGHKISHAELSQALDNLSRRGFVIKDNRGNVKLSKSALAFHPISPPAPNTAAEDAVARQANSPETCDEAATAEELQQEILDILEGAPGMTASSLHAQLTKAMRGISLHRDEFMSLLEALSIAGMVIQDKRGNIRLAPSSVGNGPAPVPPPALPHPISHTERRASPVPAPPQPSQSTICLETNGAEGSMQREQQVVKLLQGVAGISTNWLLAELKKQSSDPPWSSQELGELLDRMSEAGRVVRDTRGNIKLAKTPPLTPASSSTAAAATAHLDPSPSSWVQEAAGSPRQRAAAAATGPKPATEQEAGGVLGVSLEKEVLGVLEGEAGITFNALLAQLSSRTKRAPKATASELSRVLDVLAAEGQLVRDPRGNLRLVRRKGPQPALPPNNQHHLQQPPAPALPAAVDPAGHQLYSWSDQSTDSDFEPDSPVEVEGSAVQAGRASAEQLGVRWWVYDEGADGADEASMSEGSQTEVDEAEEVGEGEEVPSVYPLFEGRNGPDPAVQSSAWDLASTFPEAFFDIQGVAQQALGLLQRNHCLGVEQVHGLMRDDNGQAHLALWQVDAALCRLHESGLVTCTNEVYSLATDPPPSRDPPPLQTTSAAPLPALHPLHPPRTDPAALPDQEPSHEGQWSPLLPSEFEGEGEGAAEEAEQGAAVEEQWGDEGFMEAAAFGKQWGDEEAVEGTAAEQQWGGEGFLGSAAPRQQWGEGAASAAEQDALFEHEKEQAAEEEVESLLLSQALPTGAEAGPGPGMLEGSPAEVLCSSPQPAEVLADSQPADQAEGDAGVDEVGSHLDSPMLPVEPVAQANTATAHPNPPSATPLVAAGPAVDGGSAAAAKTGRRRSGSATGPGGGLAGAAAPSLTKKERASLVGKRTYALRRLRKEFDAGNMQAEEFAASAAAIEAQYAALLGAPPRPAATKPPSRSSTHGSPSSSRAHVPSLKASSTRPSPPSLAEPSAAIRNRSPDLSAPPMLLSVPGSKRPPRPASPSAHASSATQQRAGSLQPGNRSPSPPSPGTGGLSPHSGQQPLQRSSPPAASAPASTTTASAAASNSPSPPAAARPASPAPRSPPETAPARTPLFQRMGSGDSPQPSRPDLRRGSRGASGAAVSMGPGSMSVAARLQALSSGGVGNRRPSLVYDNSGPKQDSGKGTRTPSPPPGSQAAEQSAAPSPLDPSPIAEQEEISRKLQRARGVLAQVQATRQSCGEEILELESHSPSPAPPPSPPPSSLTSQRLAASSLTSPRPPPPPSQEPPPPSHPRHQAAKPADQADQAAAAPFVGQVDLGAPLLGAGAGTAPGLNGNHRPDLTTQGPGLPPSTSAPPPSDQEHAGWQEEAQQAQGQQLGQLQLGQQEQQQLEQQEQASGGVVGKGVGGFSSAGSGAEAGRIMGRLGSMSGLLPDPSDTDTMADLEGLLMMELQQDEELQQAHSQLQAMYEVQRGQGTGPQSQQQVPQGWEGEGRQQQQQHQQQLYQQQQQQEEEALQLQMLQAVEPQQQRELQQEPRSEPADQLAAAPANTTMSRGEPVEAASHKDHDDEGADEAAQDLDFGGVGLGVLGDAGGDLDAAAGDCSIMNLPPPTSGLQPRVRTPTPSRKGGDSSDRMSRSPVRQHTRSPSLARTAQSSHPGFVVSSADGADTQPSGEDPQMAIISWSITPPPETQAALAQGPGQPAAEQERVVLVQLALPYKVDFGEVIKVSGNTPEFGSWDIEHAVQMHWTAGNVWVAELRLAPGTYEIKALVRHSTMRDLVRWEEGPNHQLQVPAEPGVLQASWPWSEGPFQQSFEPAPGSQPSPPPSQPGQQGGGEGHSGNRRGWGGGEGGGGGGGGGLAAWGYPKGRPGQGDAVVGRRPPAPGQANSIIITNHRGSVIQASRAGGMAAQMLEQAHSRLEAETGGRGRGLQATLPLRKMGQATGRASGLTSNNVLASTGLRGARTVAPTPLSRSLLLPPARLLMLKDAVAHKQQQGVLLGPPALGEGGALGASVGRAVSPGRAGRSGLWLPERWEGTLGARHAAGKGQSSSPSLVPVELGKLLDLRRHLPSSQGRFKAMEDKQGDSARLPHQLLLLPDTHSLKAWVHHTSRQSRAITQPATPQQKVVLDLSGPGQPALVGCGTSLQPLLLLAPSTSTLPVPLTAPLPPSSLPAPSFTPTPVHLLTAAAATKLEPALDIAHVQQGELTTLHASCFTTVQHTALGLQHATVVPSQQPPASADPAAATLPCEAAVQKSSCLQAARPEDGSMVAGSTGPFQQTFEPTPGSQPAPPSGQPGQQGWGVQGQGNSYRGMPLHSAAHLGAPLALAATAIHGAIAGRAGPGAEGSSLPAPQPCSPSSDTGSNSIRDSTVVSTGNSSDSPGLLYEGSLLELPKPSPGLLVSTTAQTIGLGCIFQAAVLQATVQAAGQSPLAAPGRVERGCCSPPSSSQVADDTGASPARQMWLNWVRGTHPSQAVQAAAGGPGLGLQEDWVEAAGSAVQSEAGERGQAPSWRVIREEGAWSGDHKDEQEGEIERVAPRVSSPSPRQQTERPLEMMPPASHRTSQVLTPLPHPPSTTLYKPPPQDAPTQLSQDAPAQLSPAAEPAAPCSHSLPTPFLVEAEGIAEDCCHGDEHHRGHGRATEMSLREEVGRITAFLPPPSPTQLVLNSVPGLYQQLLALPPPSERWDSCATPAKVWSNLAPDTRPGQPNAQPGLAQARVQYLLPDGPTPLLPCDENSTHDQHQEVTRVWGDLATSSPPPAPGSNLSHSSPTLAATSLPTTLDHKLEGSLQQAPLPLVLACHQLQTVALTDSARHASKQKMVSDAEHPGAKQLGELHYWGQQPEQLDNQSQLMACQEAHLLADQEQAPRASSQLAVLGADEPTLVSLATDPTAKAGEALVQVEQKHLAGQWVDLVTHVDSVVSGQQRAEIHVQGVAQVGDLMWQQAQQQTQQQAQQQVQQHSLGHSSSEAQEVQQVVCDLVQVLVERPMALPAALEADLRRHEEQVHDLVCCNQPPSPGPAVPQPPRLLPLHWPIPAQPAPASQRSPSPGYEQALEAVVQFVEGANMERSRRSPSVSHTVASEVVLVGHGHSQLPVESADARSLAGSSVIGQISPVRRSSPGAETSEAALYSSGDNSNGWGGSPAKPSNIAENQACSEGVMVDIRSAGSRGRDSKEASPSPSKLSPPRQSPGRSSPSPAGVRAGQVVAQLSMSCSLPPHQVVRFVGGRPEFGAWDLAASPAFTCNDQDMWQASLALQPGYYQFKLVVLDNNSGEAVWEPGPMRALTVPEEAGGGLLILHCTWCDYEMEALFLWDPVASGAGPGAGSMLYKQARTLHCEATMDIEGME